jgi:hypothetical protein
MSSLDQAMVINAVVLFAVLEADLGRQRKIGWLRLVRPLLLAGAIVPLYLTALATHGTDLALEASGAGAGLLLGLLSTTLMRVYRSPTTGRPVSRAGLGYAAVWTVVIGGRAAFSYGSYHWFSDSLGSWMNTHHVDSDAITNTLILMAVLMVITRTLAMAIRAARTPHAVRASIAAPRPSRFRDPFDPGYGPVAAWDTPTAVHPTSTRKAPR